MNALASTLDRIAGAALAVGPRLPGNFGAAISIVGAAVGLAADIAASDASPIEHLARVRDADPQLAAMRQRWATAESNRRFP